MIDFFAQLGLAFIGVIVMISLILAAAFAIFLIANMLGDWRQARRYRALQRHHDMRIEK